MDDLRLVLHDTLLTQFLPPSCSRLVDSLLDASDVPVQRKASSAIPTDLTSPSGRFVLLQAWTASRKQHELTSFTS
jgi:hypothetical protein